MKFIWSYLKKFARGAVLVVSVKFVGTLVELLLPTVLEHLIDDVAPTKSMGAVIGWGCVMLALAWLCRFLNITANRRTVKISADTTFAIRKDLFFHSLRLSGNQLDEFGLPSLTSRMTSDSYNVQNFIRGVLAMGIRCPVLLIGGILVTLVMDRGLAAILCVIAPIVIVCIVLVSRWGIPLYDRVQRSLDGVVRIMRENITGIRVVKALSKEEHETKRFAASNEQLTHDEEKAGIIMAMPGPIMTFFLNVGLTLVVIIGARRVNSGVTQPGMILAFLTYFNMILMGAMGINRIFMLMSKANASAYRIAAVVQRNEELAPIPESRAAKAPDDSFIRFDHVSFRYGSGSTQAGSDAFAGSHRQASLTDIDFAIPKGGSLGIIGATGSGKTTIINLLMRFYDATEGHIFVDGRDIRTYDQDTLHRKFGTVFQNDVIFADTLEENIDFGRGISPQRIAQAAEDAHAAGFIADTEGQYRHVAAIRGSDFSGGQRQRLLITRALAGTPEILVLDDASSALDYRTDANLRKAIRENYGGCTCIVIAQRVSSIMNLDDILVLDEGRIIGHGSHDQLMESCPAYREIARVQMGGAL